ncbi:MAG: hypothetical protein KatS3mg124_1770 [Porticoccaceae bacterium]|nr:MAG: hypothetical protein KatS3mg124_1770 [Porticoccaceae bacterium]
MKLAGRRARLCCALFAFLAPALAPRAAPGSDALREGFHDPPLEARPRVWWHWLGGNVTREGIAADLAWLARIGVGGVQLFDADLRTPRVVEDPPPWGSDAWSELLGFAAEEAERLGLEFAVAASPGWSETGGPWVAPADGMKKLVWASMQVDGGGELNLELPPLPAEPGPFPGLPRSDSVASRLGGGEVSVPPLAEPVAVLAFPTPPEPAVPAAVFRDGAPLAADSLFDGDLTTAVELPRGVSADPVVLEFAFAEPQLLRGATLFVAGGAHAFVGANVAPRLEWVDEAGRAHFLADLPAAEVPTTAAFPARRVVRLRLTLEPARPALPLPSPHPGVDLSAVAAIYGPRLAAPWRVAEIAFHRGPVVHRYEAKAGFAVETDYYALEAGDAGEPGIPLAGVVDLTDRVDGEGVLHWHAPPGRWRVVRFGYALTGSTNHPARREATGLEVDKFDAAVVRRYLEGYLARLAPALGPPGAGRLDALLVDSFEAGAANWTPALREAFRKRRGYDPLPWLPALTGVVVESRAATDRFLYDFRRTLAELLAESHYGALAAQARELGLRVYAEALESGRPSLGDDLAMRRPADVPMGALWTFAPGEAPNPSHVADLKGAASVAHLWGRPRVAAELFTSSLAPWAHGPADLKPVADLAFALGVNLPVIHSTVHQPREDLRPGLSLFIFGQYFNRHESWAALARPWIDYLARNAFLLQQGVPVVDVAWFAGEEAPLTARFAAAPPPELPGHAYDFVDAEALREALAVEGGELVSRGGVRYQVLYLDEAARRMTLPTLERIAALVEAGATLVGLPPEGSPSLADDPERYRRWVARLWPNGRGGAVGRGRVVATADLPTALAELGIAPDFSFAGEGGEAVAFVHRRLPDGDLYFLANRGAEAASGRVRLRASGRAPELWRPETGAVEPVGYRMDGAFTEVPLVLAPGEAVHLLLRRPAEAAERVVERPRLVPAATVAGPWRVDFPPDAGVAGEVELERLTSLHLHGDEAVRCFAGVATWRTGFAPPPGWRPGKPLELDLGAVAELAEVAVNGRIAGTTWHAPHRLDIGALVRPGTNELAVRVATLWVNRLICDAGRPPEARRTWTALPSWRADAPLRPAGLLGPVRLWAEAPAPLDEPSPGG